MENIAIPILRHQANTHSFETIPIKDEVVEIVKIKSPKTPSEG